MKYRILIFLLIIFFIGCDETPTENNENTTQEITAFAFTNIQANHSSPSKIQYAFSLKDQDNHAIVISETNLSQININIIENESQLDYSESHVIIHKDNDFDLDIVLVLDFSESMQTSGFMDEMLEEARYIINSLKENHRVALIEFHDNSNNDSFSTILDFTSNKETALQTLEDYSESNINYGFSICWDALYSATDLFSADVTETQKAIMLFSDGNDNGSLVTMEEINQAAIEKNIKIYPVGIGEESSINSEILSTLATQSEGLFFYSESISYIQKKFDQILTDLGGNYVISYTTPKLESFELSLSIQYNSIDVTNPIQETIDASSLIGDKQEGLLEIVNPILLDDQFEFYIKANHIPRNVTKFRFRIDSPYDEIVSILGSSEGGLLDNWNEIAYDQEGFFVTEGNSLEFGDFGLLFKVVVQNVPIFGFSIPIYLDNSIYEDELYFYSGENIEIDYLGNWYYEVVSGITIGNPNPSNNSISYSDISEFSWEIYNLPAETEVMYDLFMDEGIDPPASILVSQLTESVFVPDSTFTLTDSTKYYWRVRYYSENFDGYSPTWAFEISVDDSLDIRN